MLQQQLQTYSARTMLRSSKKSCALVVGVSEYELLGFSDLPACINDTLTFSEASRQECYFDASDIRVLNGRAAVGDFRSELETLLLQNADTVVIYFSGHGNLSGNNEVDLVFTDGTLSASSLIKRCQCSCQASWLILDMCHAGAVSLDAKPFEDLNAKAGEGCVLFASCSPDMVSYVDSGSPYSAFTTMLVEAMRIARCKEGHKCLPDIERALHCLVRNRNMHTSYYQRPLSLHSSVGPIRSHNPDCIPFQWHASPLPVTEFFEVKKVEPCFADRKRYSCEVVAKTHLDRNTLIQGLPELVGLLRTYETYDTKLQQQRWEGERTQVLFIYVAASNTDYLNSIFPFCVTWSTQGCNEKIGRGTWCDEVQCWIKEQRTPDDLEEMRRLHAEGSISDEAAIQQAKDSLNRIAVCASEVFIAGDYWLGGLKNTDEFSEIVKANKDQIEEALGAALQIGFPSENLRPIEDLIIDLAGALRDIPLFFLGCGRAGRSEENLRQCFDITRRRYDSARMKIAEIFDSGAC